MAQLEGEMHQAAQRAAPDQPAQAAALDQTGQAAAPDQTLAGPALESTASGTASSRTATGTASGRSAPAPASASTAARAGHAGNAEQLWPMVLRAAWMAILLGFVIEALLLAGAVALGAYKGPKPFLADLAQKVTWSVIVCVGIAFGTAASKARPPVMGLLGLAAAPLGFQVARTIHKGMAQALSLAGGGIPFVPVVLVGVLKSLEYGVLGWSVGWAGRRWGTLGAHVATGFVVGLTFGTALTLLTAQTAGGLAPTPELVAKGINEVLFPVGCSLVLYAADALGKRMA